MDMKTLICYQHCINKIDDLLEYQYTGMSGDVLRDEIMDIIDELNKQLSMIGNDND